MEKVLIVLFIASIFVWFSFLIDALLGIRSIRPLENEVSLQRGPLLSVIVAARNEEDKLQASIVSQLKQTYENVEWILVNDRSSDATGDIMESLKEVDSRIKVIHIKKLPEGWLGKNYALYRGYLQATGKRLLFTDADVKYERAAFAKGLAFFDKYKLDHLTAAPNLHDASFWLKTFIAFFLFSFSYLQRPWRANVQKSKVGMGIGAFNLVSKAAYETFGTHKRIKMRPDDDLQLGMQMKEDGFRQRMVTALQLIKVEWYGSIKEALIGLEKNTFAGLHYRMSMVLFAAVGIFLTNVLPFIAIFSSNDTVALLALATIIICGIFYSLIVKKMTLFSPMMFIVLPITALLFIYSIIRASYLTFRRGGIVWRETKYSLKELKEGKNNK